MVQPRQRWLVLVMMMMLSLWSIIWFFGALNHLKALEGNPDDRAFCDSTGSWYSCNTPACSFVRPCESNPDLLTCSCSRPAPEQVKVYENLIKIDPCNHVSPSSGLSRWQDCEDFLKEPVVQPQSSCITQKVPKIITAVGRDKSVPYNLRLSSAGNPSFELHYYSDGEALDFIRKYCGAEVANAYECLVAPAYRADLFRFCKLYTDGGFYQDSDIVLLDKIEETVSMCSGLTLGNDFPQPNRDAKPGDELVPAKQMKMLASIPGHPVTKCMMDNIVDNVRRRVYPRHEFLLSGPQLLHLCYMRHKNHPAGVDITYRDTRAATYPHSGMMGLHKLLAFETPDHYSPAVVTAMSDRKVNHYHEFFEKGIIYEDTCKVPCDQGDCRKRAPWAPMLFLEAGNRLRAGQSLISGGVKYCRHTPRTNGPMFLWKSHNESTAVLQDMPLSQVLGTPGNNEPRANLQSDGNLVVYKGEAVVWSSSTFGNEHLFGEVRQCGDFVLKVGNSYNGKETIVWRSNGIRSNQKTGLVLLSSGALAICEKSTTSLPVHSSY